MKKTTTTNKEVIASKEEKNMNETIVKAGAPANNSIIDVIVNGMNGTEVIDEINIRLQAVEKSVFNIALLCSYGTGVTIPAYTDNKGVQHAEATIEKPAKQKDFITRVNRSSKAISRWIIAMNLIIEEGYFTDFASGVYPFSYDKIIAIFRNKEAFMGTPLVELMSMSAKYLESIAEEYKAPSEETEADSNSKEESVSSKEVTTEAEAPDEEVLEVATISYNGKEYHVNKQAFEKWLAENMLAD